MADPFRNEADAFALAVRIIVSFAGVIAVAELVSSGAAVVAGVLIAALWVLRWYRARPG